MPTIKQIEELLNNTKIIYKYKDNCFILESKINGNQLILPCMSFYDSDGLAEYTNETYIVSSEYVHETNEGAKYFVIDKTGSITEEYIYNSMFETALNFRGVLIW